MNTDLSCIPTADLFVELRRRCRGLAIAMVAEPNAEKEVGDKDHGGAKLYYNCEKNSLEPMIFSLEELLRKAKEHRPKSY